MTRNTTLACGVAASLFLKMSVAAQPARTSSTLATWHDIAVKQAIIGFVERKRPTPPHARPGPGW